MALRNFWLNVKGSATDTEFDARKRYGTSKASVSIGTESDIGSFTMNQSSEGQKPARGPLASLNEKQGYTAAATAYKYPNHGQPFARIQSSFATRIIRAGGLLIFRALFRHYRGAESGRRVESSIARGCNIFAERTHPETE